MSWNSKLVIQSELLLFWVEALNIVIWGKQMKTIKNVLSVCLTIIVISACNNEADIANLGGESTGVSNSAESCGDEAYDRFIDNCKYDHCSAEEYKAHILEAGRVSVQDVKDNYAVDTEYLCNNPKNLFTFDNCEIIPFPNISDVSAVTFNESNLSCEEAWDIIKYWLDKWNLSDQVDMDKSVVDPSRRLKYGDEYHYALAKDVWDETTGSGLMLFDDDLCYIQMLGSGIGILSHGVITDYVGSKRGEKISRTLDPYDVFGEVEKSGSMEELQNETYTLIDGSTMSIKEASSALDGFYSFAEDLGCEISSVDVVKAEDRYYYRFNIRRVYRGVPLTVHHYGNISEYVHSLVMSGDVGKLYVADQSGVCAFFGMAGNPIITPLVEPQTQMLGVRDAMQIVYGIMSEDYQCNIDRIELCMGYYCQAEGNVGKPGIFVPTCWEFTGHSDVSGKNIKIDVDVLTGEIGFLEYWVNEE